MNINWKAVWEAVKEPLRWFVIALIPILINWISGQPWNAEAIGIAIAVIRIVDKMLHDYGKESGNTTIEGGLTRF